MVSRQRTWTGPGRSMTNKPDMHADGKSDTGIVPGKAPKGAAETADEVLEGRPERPSNPPSPTATGTQSPEPTDLGLRRIREAAQRDKGLCLNNLLHHVTPERLRQSYFSLKRNAAAGVDEQTWSEYADGELDAKLADLHEQVQSGRYRPLPSKRIWIPKADGKKRPIGVAALEDKIVQKALAQILNAIYENDFLGFSYGFREGRKPHDALDALWIAITERKVNWIVDADIRTFFDTLDHEWVLKFVMHRVGDRRVHRLISLWLKAGVLEEGKWFQSDQGTPQGGIISPLLANIYLHYVLDLWVESWRKHSARGEVYIVRYADDFVMGFQYESEARRFVEALKKRLERFGLGLHEEKTRLIEFGRFATRDRDRRGQGRPETFDFLGFTHICAHGKKGRFWVKRQTISKRLRAKLREIKEQIHKRRHEPVKAQGQWLRSVVQGCLNYAAVVGNRDILDVFRTQILHAWLKALRRRSHKARMLTWKVFGRICEPWIPHATTLHPLPNERFHGTTRSRSRMR
jgi:RNA-directed DNA polymerase